MFVCLGYNVSESSLNKYFNKGILDSLAVNLLNEIVDIRKLSNDTMIDLLRATGVSVEYY